MNNQYCYIKHFYSNLNSQPQGLNHIWFKFSIKYFYIDSFLLILRRRGGRYYIYFYPIAKPSTIFLLSISGRTALYQSLYSLWLIPLWLHLDDAKDSIFLYKSIQFILISLGSTRFHFLTTFYIFFSSSKILSGVPELKKFELTGLYHCKFI